MGQDRLDRGEPLNLGRREYRLKGWFAAIYLLFGTVNLVLGLVAVGVDFIEPHLDIKVFLIGLFFLAVATYTVTWTLSSRLIISDSHIESRVLFNKGSADLNQIRGFHTVHKRSGTYIRISLKGSTETISFSANFNTDDAFRRWMQGIPDLDFAPGSLLDLDDAPRT